MRLAHMGKSLFLGVLVALGMGVGPAWGAFLPTVTSNVTKLSASSYLYSYTVSVAATSTSSVSEFDMVLGAAIDPDSIMAPTAFFPFYTPGDPFIFFTAFEDGTNFPGIAPGSSGVFSFISSGVPVAALFQTSGFDPVSGLLVSTSGMILTPGVVPEPASLLLASLGFCGTLGLLARSRRRGAVTAG